MTKRFIGLDGEMTAVQTDLPEGSPPARLIQIGVALGAGNIFTESIAWQKGDYGTTPEATAVHGFDEYDIENGNDAEWVDKALYEWLTNQGVGMKEGIAVGWNVASFDMQQFVIPTLPLTASLFSYRAVDLNSICFAIEEARNLLNPAQVKGPEQKFDTWKKRAKEISVELMGYENFHDAGYDAAASLLQFQWLAMQIGGGLF